MTPSWSKVGMNTELPHLLDWCDVWKCSFKDVSGVFCKVELSECRRFGFNRWDAGQGSFLQLMNYWCEGDMKNISRTWEALTRAALVSKSVVFFLIVVLEGEKERTSVWFLRQTTNSRFPTILFLILYRKTWVSCWTFFHFNIRISAFRCSFFVFPEKKRHLHFVWDMGSWAMCCPKSHGSLWGPEQKAELGHSLHLLPQREGEKERGGERGGENTMIQANRT